ncbi:MAG: TIGR00730 family Rossman fold protein [Caldilineaceae bacterium]
MNNELRSICVFCGANMGANPAYAAAAEEFARAMVAREIGLVYGGGSVGLMGMVARTVRDGGGRVTGVIPRALTTRELSGETIGELLVVDTMAERKERMLTLADAFVALPGGLGTLDELFEALTWGQLGIQSKPVALLNVLGFFDPLLAWYDHALTEGFIRPQHRHMLLSGTSAAALLDEMAAHEVPAGLVQWKSSDQTLEETFIANE